MDYVRLTHCYQHRCSSINTPEPKHSRAFPLAPLKVIKVTGFIFILYRLEGAKNTKVLNLKVCLSIETV